MNKLTGVLLVILAIALGLIATLNLLALLSAGAEGELDIKYGLLRVAIVFITSFFAFKSFKAGKQKF